MKTKRKRPPSKVSVRRPDRATGEVVNEVVSANRFKAEATALSHEVIAKVLAGQHPPLVWSAESPCPVERGQEITLKKLQGVPQVSLTITRIKGGKKGEHMAEYRVRDDRPEYLRHNIGTTRSPSDSVDPEAPVIDPTTLQEYATAGEQKTAIQGAERSLEAKRRGKEQRAGTETRSERAVTRHKKAVERAKVEA